MTLDEQSHRAFERLVRQRPNRTTTSASNAGRPVVVPDAATRKANLDRVNDAIRQGATKTPWPVPTPDAGTDDGDGAA